MNQTWSQLEAALPIELVSRSFSYSVTVNDTATTPSISADDDPCVNISTTCCNFVAPYYGGLATPTKTLCENHPMDDPDSIKFYINATWYPGTPENPSKWYTFF